MPIASLARYVVTIIRGTDVAEKRAIGQGRA